MLITLGLMLVMVRPVRAQNPGYSASPSASLSTAPTAVKENICRQLATISGNESLAPANVTFKVTTDSAATVTKYRFHFGDGVVEDSPSAEMSHTYLQAGGYQAFVELYDTAGVGTTSDACQTQVTINKPPLAPVAVGCSEVIVTGDKQAATVSATLTVQGFGEVKGYRIVYHDNVSESSSASGVFRRTFTTPGTFPVYGYVQNELGNWVGGESLCKQYVYVYTGGMTSQPQTGVGTGVWVAIGAALFAGLGLWRLGWEKRKSS